MWNTDTSKAGSCTRNQQRAAMGKEPLALRRSRIYITPPMETTEMFSISLVLSAPPLVLVCWIVHQADWGHEEEPESLMSNQKKQSSVS